MIATRYSLNIGCKKIGVSKVGSRELSLSDRTQGGGASL